MQEQKTDRGHLRISFGYIYAYLAILFILHAIHKYIGVAQYLVNDFNIKTFVNSNQLFVGQILKTIVYF